MELEQLVSEDQIRARSHAIWEREGYPEGRAEEHWLRAIAELHAELQRSWLVAQEERENSTLAMPHPDVHQAPQHLEAGRCRPDMLKTDAA
jgi:hypothetical protein